MCLEDLDQPLILGSVFFQALQFVTAGAEGAGGGGQQFANVGRALFAGIDEIFLQGTDNPIAACVNLTDFGAVLAGGFNEATGGGVDDGGAATGVGVKGIFS